MQGSSGIQQKNNHLDYSFSWRNFSILYILCLSTVMVTIFSFQTHSRPLSLTHPRNAELLFFFFSLCLLLRCWKPFDLQSRVLLIDWCFHTVTLAESPVFRGPRCHSGTNALEFSQIIPLCAVCVSYCVDLRGEMESIYLYICLFVSLSGYLLLIIVFIHGGAVTFNVSSWREI